MTTAMVMASPISTTHPFLCSSSSPASSSSSRPSICSHYSSVSLPKNPKLRLSSWVPQLGFSPFSPWSGLKHLGIYVTPKTPKLEKNRKGKGMVVQASLFGVGAPEALVIGVVALLVFGPKGLAEVARTLGKTLRTFQPTIRELQEVSKEFKSTLEREIGLDEISSSTQDMYSTNRTNTVSTPPSVVNTKDSQTEAEPSENGTSSANRAYTNEEFLNIREEQLKASAAQQQVLSPPQGESQSEPQIQPQDGASSPNRAYTTEEYLKITEEQLKAAAAQQQVQSPPQGESRFEPQTQPQAAVKETAGAVPPPQKPENST